MAKQKTARGAGVDILHTNCASIEYKLTFKKIKNINIRVKTDGQVVVSAPLFMPQSSVNAFITEKAAWVVKTRQKMLAAPKPMLAALPPKQSCESLFEEISLQIFPLFASLLGGQAPEIVVKPLKSSWGVCYPQKKRIVLSAYLALKPRAAVEYVVLHEYVHFLHQNHQAGFHAQMQSLMPDYKKRRALLRV